MFNSDTDLLFPPRAIPALRDLRGPAWKSLVERVMQTEGRHPDRLAFVLMMVRLSACASCQADSFRAMRGCTQCAAQTVRRFRGSDKELLALFDEALGEVEAQLRTIVQERGLNEQKS